MTDAFCCVHVTVHAAECNGALYPFEGSAMLVYRIEDSKGRGAFNNLVFHARDIVQDAGFWNEPNPVRHPSPNECPVLRPVFKGWGDQYFGFDTIQKLVSWFDSERIRVAMHELGGRVVVYECPDEHCVIAPEQMIFIKSKARVVEYIPIPTISTER